LDVTTIYVTHDQVESMAMADHIAVMDKGVTQQIGTPTEIYGRPRNEFVAGFIGEPPMNFADCEFIKEGSDIRLKSPSLNISLEPRLKEKLATYAGAPQVKIGIRPEDVSIHSETKGNSVSAKVDFVEVQGERNILTLELKGNEIFLVAVGSDIKPALNSTVQLLFDMNHLHIFEAASGNNLTY
jgi:multiple sugar transport system ATP-binding protein